MKISSLLRTGTMVQDRLEPEGLGRKADVSGIRNILFDFGKTTL